MRVILYLLFSGEHVLSRFVRQINRTGIVSVFHKCFLHLYDTDVNNKYLKGKFVMADIKIAVVTGGTSGIGEQIASLLSSNGYRVYSIARKIGNNKAINYVGADVSDPGALKVAADEIVRREGRIDVLINNAGCGLGGAVENHTPEEIDYITAVNFKGLVNITRLFLPQLRKSRGKIINIGSIAGEIAIPFQTMYSATKSAVHSFTVSLANELRPFGVGVCCVMPGDTKTSFTANRVKSSETDVYGERVKASVERMEKDEQNGTSPKKVAEVVLRCLKKKKMPLKIAVGFKYKFLLLIAHILPQKLVNLIIFRMYAK